MRFENITLSINVSKDDLTYCFLADTQDEFDRRMEQLANNIRLKVEWEIFKEVMKRGVKNE